MKKYKLFMVKRKYIWTENLNASHPDAKITLIGNYIDIITQLYKLNYKGKTPGRAFLNALTEQNKAISSFERRV